MLSFLRKGITMSDNYFIKQAIGEVIDDFLRDTKGICTCDICKKRMSDMVTKRLAGRYKLTKEDVSYARIQGIDIQLKADAVKELNNIAKNSPGNFHDTNQKIQPT